MRVGVVALVFKDGKVLMERRLHSAEDDNYWGLIAGGKESGETVVEAMEREVREETGAKFHPEKIVGLVDHEDQHGGGDWWTVLGFRGTIEGEIQEDREPDKRDEFGWFDLEDLPEPLHPTTEMMLEAYRHTRLHIQL